MNRWRREWLAGNPACRAQQPHSPRIAQMARRGKWRPTPPNLPPWCIPSNWRAHAAHYLNEAGQHRRGLVVRQIGARTVATEARTPDPSGARVCVYTAEHLRKIDRAAIHRAFLPA